MKNLFEKINFPKDIGYWLIEKGQSEKRRVSIPARLALWAMNILLVVLNLLPNTLFGGHPQESISSRTGKVLAVLDLDEIQKSFTGEIPIDVINNWVQLHDKEHEFGLTAIGLDYRLGGHRPVSGFEQQFSRLAAKLFGKDHYYRKISLREGRFSGRDRSIL